MLFNSLDYLLFLAVAVAGYWALARTHIGRLLFVFLASCAFYMAWQVPYILLILGSTALDYLVGWRIHRARTQRVRRAWLGVSVVGNLGLLGTFKYFNFFSAAIGDALGVIGIGVSPPFLDVLLPVGISFYTFQTLSYTIDIYRGRLEPARNPLDFAVFVTYFPQLVAGPIVRASELLPQLARPPRLAEGMIGRGLFFIATGLIKKVAIADFLSVNLVDRVFANPEYYTATETVLALYGFTMQIYCDFSGYTDVARGSAMLMGLELPENFDRPYRSTSPAEFWRRWHMTLSTWLRDYLYFPLGGSRVGPVRAYLNLWITMFLIGIWHGASWTFVLYALLQAFAMVLHRFFYRLSGRTADTVDPLALHAFKIFACLQFVVFSRILFRATSLDNAWEVTARLWSNTWSMAQIAPTVWLALLIPFAAHYVPKSVWESVGEWFVRLPAVSQGFVLGAVGIALAGIATGDVVPFIYFQF
jgi:D-alanyl-lipoteichoic acid acyltransferase DltB (MBOAT superfamily)